jgi:hypothetical protein
MKMHYKNFLKAYFRRSSHFRLLEWEQLSTEEQQVLSGLYDADDVYGLFQPCTDAVNFTPKVAYKDVALLYLHLQEAGLLPRCFRANCDATLHQTIARLVLDSVLEINCNEGFVTGSRAINTIFEEWAVEHFSPFTHTATLSLQAIAYAFLLRNLPVKELAAQLYSFHSTPWDAEAKTNFTATYTVHDYLFLQATESWRRTFEENWSFLPASPGYKWYSWTKHASTKQTSSWLQDTYKLYISPSVDDLPAVFATVVPCLTKSEAYCFKVGSTVPGILRPDKMVVYFETYESLAETAATLKQSLSGFAVQGVPFTCQLDDKGLLSWGIDPPKKDVLPSVEAGSWRTYLADQLSLAVVQAQTEFSDWKEALPFIRAKLQTAGIDMTNWTRIQV